MRYWILMAGVLAAGCTPVPSTPGVTNVPVTARPGVAAPLAQGETALVVRAVSAADTRTELAGASCRAESDYFTASFTAPARVLVPDYGASSPVVTVTCQAGGAAGSLAARPTAAWSGGMGGWPAVGISVGTGTNVGVGVGWYGGGIGTGTSGAGARYPELRVPLIGA